VPDLLFVYRLYVPLFTDIKRKADYRLEEWEGAVKLFDSIPPSSRSQKDRIDQEDPRKFGRGKLERDNFCPSIGWGHGHPPVN